VVWVTWVVLGVSYAFGAPFGVAQLLTFGLLGWLIVPLARRVARSALGPGAHEPERTAVLGAGHVGQLVARKILQHPETGLELVGFVDAAPRELEDDLRGVAVLGGTSELPALVGRHKIARLIVAFSTEASADVIDTVRWLEDAGVRVDIVPRLFELMGPAVRVGSMEGFPYLELGRPESSVVARAVKRALDVVGAASILLLTAPLLAAIAWRIAREDNGPVLFRQTRLGRDMRQFTTYKFRTMRVDVSDAEHRSFIGATAHRGATPSENGLFKLERNADITAPGRWLRRTSLDELPQLWNVLRGEMSLVGPRPCLPYEVEHFAPHHFNRFRVRPGLTGYWQVTARARASFGEALDLDVAYVGDWSLALDLRLLAATPAQLFATGATR
jgi:exopolysaccharide biosynthesis polyprenyl glycosylphosphotransferase